MAKSVPTPVAAAIGIVPSIVDGVRQIPGRAVQLPVLAVSSALTALENARKEYDALADRGEQFLGKLRGQSLEDLEDRVEDALQAAPVDRAYGTVEDAVENAVAGVRDLFDTAATTTRNLRAEAGDLGTEVRSRADQAAAPVPPKDEQPEDEQPKGEPTPEAPRGGVTRVDTAATPDVVETVEQVVQASSAPTVLTHDALPLEDYDHLTLGALRGRMRSLTVDELVQVRAYEKSHGDRLPIVTMLDNRIAKLATDAAAT